MTSKGDPVPPPARVLWLTCAGLVGLCLATLIPTLGDMGLTYDEPAYRFSQEMSGQWWERLGAVRSQSDLAEVMDPDTLLHYWPYARHGINFHPPLAGQLNLLTYALTGNWLKDIPARRLATALQYTLTIALLFVFLARRYGLITGLAAALALLTMPRVFGQAHLIDTDLPGLCIWTLAAMAFWKGLHESNSGAWRIAVGVLAGLAFVQKLGAVFVFLALVGWLVFFHLPRARWHDWLDGLLTTIALLLPLGVIFAEILRLAKRLPAPQYTNLLRDTPPSAMPGAIMLVPLVIWILRRGLGRVARSNPVLGPRRPALEIWTAILAFGPAVSWLGNPAWWRETLPRLAHYYQLTTARRGALPDIQNIYWGRVYEYGLPWTSGWTLIGITVPVTLLAAGFIGTIYAIVKLARGDRLPALFLFLFLIPPLLRILPTPAHDGVRLILPSFAFLAALAGWGTGCLGNPLARLVAPRAAIWARLVVLAAVVLPAGWSLARIHPYELSYYNALIGGPRGAWERGFELSYWYDAFTPSVLADMNQRLPQGVAISYANEQSNPVMIIQDLQALGELRGDLVPWDAGRGGTFGYMLLLTHDSKASPFTRLLFAMEPWYASRPAQLDGPRIVTVADPVAVSRAWALHLLAHGPAATPEPEVPNAPGWVRRYAPFLKRLWGDGLTRLMLPNVNEPVFEWARDDPDSLLNAAQALVVDTPATDTPEAARLRSILTRDDDPALGRDFSRLLLKARPQSLIEAVRILIMRGDAVREILEHPGYLDPERVGGYLDRDLAGASPR